MTDRIDLAIVTARTLPEEDEDEAPLVAALAARGITTRVTAWDETPEVFAAARRSLLRSPWDYFFRPVEFRGWLETQERLVNPREVALWNMHKGYLLELGAAGIPVVPTLLVEAGASADLSAFAKTAEHGFVVKPAISGGSWRTSRVSTVEEARAKLASFDDDALVQPLVPSVLRRGETAAICIAGVYSHAVRKEARFDGDPPRSGIVDIDRRERAAVDRILGWLEERFPPLLYTRIDLAEGPDGTPLLMELEVLEPSLYLASAGKIDAFADAVARMLADGGR